MSVLAAAIVAAATLGMWPPRVRLGTLPAVSPGSDGSERAALSRLRIPLSGLAFVAGWAFLGGAIGVLAGLLVAAWSWRILGRVESPALRRRREQLEADLPTGVDLVGMCLSAGGSLDRALLLVSDALPGPLAEDFSSLRHRLEMGVDPGTVWRELSEHPQLGPLGAGLLRAHQSGAAVTDTIRALATELRSSARADVEQRARSVDVLASAPLGVCFLPAFVLVGVVPLVVGIFSSMRLFG